MSISERFQEIRTGFERPFWIANLTEIFERLSYYAVFAALAPDLRAPLAREALLTLGFDVLLVIFHPFYQMFLKSLKVFILNHFTRPRPPTGPPSPRLSPIWTRG